MIESVGCRGGNQLVRGVASRPTHWPTCLFIGDSFMLAFNVRVSRLSSGWIFLARREYTTQSRKNQPQPYAMAQLYASHVLEHSSSQSRALVLVIFFSFLNSKVTENSDVSTFQDINGRGRVFYFGNFSAIISHTEHHPTSPLSLHLSRSTRRSRKMKRENGSSRSSLEGRR